MSQTSVANSCRRAGRARPSRRQQYSASTKRALVDVAEELFTEHGYAATSLDAIVAGAQVTKGALYHHFSGKQARLRGGLRAHRGRRVPRHPAGPARAPRPVGEGDRRAARVPRGGPGAALPPDRDPGGPRRSSATSATASRRSARPSPTSSRSCGRCSAPAPGSSTRTCSRPSPGSSSARCRRPASPSPARPTRCRRPRHVETAIGFILAGFRALADSGVTLPRARLLLREGDVRRWRPGPARSRPCRRAPQVAGHGRQRDRRVQRALLPGAAHQAAVVEEHAPGPCRSAWSPGTGLPAGSR